MAGSQRGRSQARETEPVKPVADAVIDAPLPFLRRQVQAMVRLQRHTGMRPGEVVVMRTIDLDTGGRVWMYRPGSDQGPAGQHKTAWRRHAKVIAIGLKGQQLLKPWLSLNLTEYLFQPREAVAEFRGEQRANRKTKVPPSQQCRKKKRPKKRPRERYTSRSYHHAVYATVAAANRTRLCHVCKQRLKAERKRRGRSADITPCPTCQASQLPHWHPNQIRHTKATEIRREFGLDAARVVLGHRSPQITAHYAELDVGRVAEVMEKLG